MTKEDMYKAALELLLEKIEQREKDPIMHLSPLYFRENLAYDKGLIKFALRMGE